MKIKFQNGLTVEVLDNEGVSKKETLNRIRGAVKAYNEYKDCMNNLTKDSTMTRTFDPNVSFSIANIKSAVKEKNQKSLDKELWYFNRDLNTDLDEDNDYINMYTPVQLATLINKYKDVVVALRKGSPDYDEIANDIENRINKLEVKFKLATEQPKEEVKEEIKKEEPKVEEVKEEEVVEETKVEEQPKLEEKIEEPKVEEVKEEIKETEAETKEEVEEVKENIPQFKFVKKKETKDVPPFYDPTVSIKMDVPYRKTVIERAGRHKEPEALKVEYPDIIESIDQDIADPGRVKYFRKDELRKVTDEYYYLGNIYRECGLTELADIIKQKTDELYYNVWHLGVQ